MADPPTFAARLRALREAAGLLRADLAERTGLSLVAIYRYESGTRLPGGEAAGKLAAALGCKLDDFR